MIRERGAGTMDQETRLCVFEDTLDRCGRDSVLLGAIACSRAGTWTGEDVFALAEWLKERVYEMVLVADAGCLQILERTHRQLPEGRSLVVNIGSVMYPGGGVTRGADEPEAQLCRCSTLYPCLTWEIPDVWYQGNRRAFQDRGGFIFTPDIVVTRGGRREEWLREKDRYRVDVVTAGEATVYHLGEQLTALSLGAGALSKYD